jgi:nitrogen regulatory protein PII
MESVKRIEIVTEARQMPAVIAALESAGITAYTLLKDVVGRGERGLQGGDELTDVFKNNYLLTTCTAEQLERVVAAVRPILARRGGICLVSDALWVRH